MEALLAKLPGDPVANAAAIAVIVLPTVDFILGSLRAIASRQFTLDSFSTWVRSSLAGHALPIVFLLIVGQAFGTVTVGDFSFNALLTGAEVAAAAFVATTAKSIYDSLNPKVPDVVPPPAT